MHPSKSNALAIEARGDGARPDTAQPPVIMGCGALAPSAGRALASCAALSVPLLASVALDASALVLASTAVTTSVEDASADALASGIAAPESAIIVSVTVMENVPVLH